MLVEETPLGLSAEQMTKSNPDAVAAFKAEGAAADRARLSALQSAFPEDAAFALQAFSAGQSVIEAKAAKYDELAPQLKALREENAALKSTVENGKVVYTYDKQEGANQQGADAGDLNAKAEEIWAKNPKLQAEFGGQKSAFLADFKRHPETY